jgi:hypothetical protein
MLWICAAPVAASRGGKSVTVFIKSCFALGLFGLVSLPALASQAVYDLSIRGFHVGVMTLSAHEQGRSYSVAGRIENTGLLKVFRSFRYKGQAQGQITRDGLRSATYSERADTGKRVSEVELAYARGVPQVLHLSPERPADAEALVPSTLGRTVDPLTGVYALLRDTTRGKACKLDVQLFDGQRLSRMAMQPAGQDEAGLPICQGVYQRLRGYSAEEIAQHTQFTFTLRYQAAAGGQLQVKSLKFRTDYGKAEVHRR